MKLTDILDTKKTPTISFEFFPPRTEKAAKKFEGTLQSLLELHPDFVSVTFGAGGSSREGSYNLVKQLKQTNALEVIAYVAAYGLAPEILHTVLSDYHNVGVDTILCVRGDKPRDDVNFQPHPDSFEHASEFLQFARKNFSFCLGVAGYPEGHIEAVSKEKDLEYLKLKVANGAQYIITQFSFDTRFFFEFVHHCKAMGITVPILAGVMPITSATMIEKVASSCGASVPASLKEKLGSFPTEDQEAVKQYGIEFAIQQCRDLIKGGAQGIHLYTMNQQQAPIQIVQTLRNEGLV